MTSWAIYNMMYAHSTNGLKTDYNMNIIVPAWWTHLQL